jgi:Ca2+-binding RTX toxin-like protein
MWGGPGADRFVFYPGFDTNRIMDFDPTEGDRLQLGAGLWQEAGTLTAAEIVDRYGSINEFGNAVLDFTASGGTVVVLVGYDDLETLASVIDIL